MGDQNADPFDGDSFSDAIRPLLKNARLNQLSNPLAPREVVLNLPAIPSSVGGAEQSFLQGAANVQHRGNPAHDTADAARFGVTTLGDLRSLELLGPEQGTGLAGARRPDKRERPV